MIKCALRHNSIFPFQFLIWTFFRDIETTLISYFFDLDYLLIYTPLMFLGEFLAGLTFYLYQKQFLSKKKKGKITNFMPIQFVKAKHRLIKDSKTKIIFLLITTGASDFVQFVILLQTSKFMTLSGSLEQRLRGIFTINYALFYYYILRLPIFKHQIFSLIIIAICIIIVIITEFIFQEINIFLSYVEFIYAFLLIFIAIFFSTLMESIEKYLFEYNELNPFLTLLFEGIFGFILTSIYCIFNSPFDDIINFYKNKQTYEFTLLIFTLILYVILSGGKNSFRVVTTKIYSPMTSSFMEYILNPFYLIYYFISGSDFISLGKNNFVYFIINFVISLIITFCGGVYNEFLILFCCGLERDTYIQVRNRSNFENELNKLYEGDDDDSSISSDYILELNNIE